MIVSRINQGRAGADLRWQSLAKGTASFILPAARASWGHEEPFPAEHFYQIFLRHYQHAEHHIRVEPMTLAELGPGDSIGVGLAALICGVAKHYIALDVDNLLDVERNLAIFDRLVELFRMRTPASNSGPFSGTFPFATVEVFPAYIDAHLCWSMAPDRLAAIRADISAQSGRFISVNVPWREDALPPKSVDWILTQAVLEHIDDIDAAYACFATWLKPGGVMSHMIDFFSHGLTKSWNGHWAIGDFVWALTRGKRTWLINRLPMGEHLARLDWHGFRVVEALRYAADRPGHTRDGFAPRFRGMSVEDSVTRMAFLVCTGPRGGRQ